MVKKKGMSIDIGIKRLSILKEKELISDDIFNDSKELLLKSEMEIFRGKSSWFDEFLNKLFLADTSFAFIFLSLSLWFNSESAFSVSESVSEFDAPEDPFFYY